MSAKNEKPFLLVELDKEMSVCFRLDDIRRATWIENCDAWGDSLELNFGNGVDIELSGTQAEKVYEMLKRESVLLEKE